MLSDINESPFDHIIRNYLIFSVTSENFNHSGKGDIQYIPIF